MRSGDEVSRPGSSTETPPKRLRTEGVIAGKRARVPGATTVSAMNAVEEDFANEAKRQRAASSREGAATSTAASGGAASGSAPSVPVPSATTVDESVDVDEGLKCPRWLWEALYPYQQEGLRWLWDLRRQKQGGVLADDPGLGKTVQTIAFLAALHHSGHLKATKGKGSQSGVLVVCPATLAIQWKKEINLWYPPLPVKVLHQPEGGSGREEAVRNSCAPQQVTVTTYETLRLVADALVEVPWTVVILDEGQKIRNPNSLVTLAAKRFTTPHRIVLSGSPVQSGLTDLWSLLDFARPGRLGTLPVFMEEIARPIETVGALPADQVGKPGTLARAAAAYQTATALRELIQPCILRRSKEEVMATVQLPHKEEHVLLCHLSAEQYAAYLGFLQSQRAKQLRSNSRRPDPGQAMYAISVFRRLCNHPDMLIQGLDRDNKELQPLVHKIPWSFDRSGKMVVLSSAMKTWHAEGHRVLVFVQTQQMSEVIQVWLRQAGYTHLRLDNKTPVQRRLETIEEFNKNQECFAMVLTTRIGGVGLNIIGADRVVLFDPDWNPMTDVQARERAWRIGQRKDVLVYRLILAGTVEEKIYQRQVGKHHHSEKVMIKLRDGVTEEPMKAEHEPLYRRISFADILEVPPPPPSFDPQLLALLKDKYRLVFERLDPEDGGDEYRSGSQDLVKAWAGESAAEQRGGGAIRAQGDCALLQTLLDAKGIRASFNHDTVERLLVDRKAVRDGAGVVVGRALNALRDSARERAAHGVNEPTWTGKHGNAGRPSEEVPASRSVKCASSSSTTRRSGTRGDPAAGRGRKQGVPSAAPSAEVCEGVERLAAQGLTLTDTVRELAEAILRSFLDPQLAGPDRRLTTSQVLTHLAANVTADQRKTFKSLLGRMCTLTKSDSPEVPGIWTLRPELRPRGVARAGA
jgi:DNA excision repair protein ERCC-6